MTQFWKKTLAVCGLAGVGSFVFWSFYTKWLGLSIFSKLDKEQTFIIMLVFLILSFLALVFILITYTEIKKGRKANKNIILSNLTIYILVIIAYVISILELKN